MTDLAAISCTYADWKLIKTRGVVQLVFELPVENADKAYAVVGGMPDMARERWFAIARLNENKSAPSTEREKKSWHEMPPAQQAGILCNEPPFISFLVYKNGIACNTADEAAEIVRRRCGVKSRSDINDNDSSGMLWRQLVSDYRAWMREPEIVP